MTKWKRIGQDAWVEMPKPAYIEAGSENWQVFINRTHHPIHNLESGWWKDGEVKELDKDFYLADKYENPVDKYSKIITVAIPLKPQPMSERKEDEIPNSELIEMAGKCLLTVYNRGGIKIFIRTTISETNTGKTFEVTFLDISDTKKIETNEQNR